MLSATHTNFIISVSSSRRIWKYLLCCSPVNSVRLSPLLSQWRFGTYYMHPIHFNTIFSIHALYPACITIRWRHATSDSISPFTHNSVRQIVNHNSDPLTLHYLKTSSDASISASFFFNFFLSDSCCRRHCMWSCWHPQGRQIHHLRPFWWGLRKASWGNNWGSPSRYP